MTRATSQGSPAASPAEDRAKESVETVVALQRVTASPISRMGTSVGMTGGSLADLNYWRCAGSSVRLMTARQEDTQICDDLASRSRANCPLRTPSVFRNCPKCSSTLAFDTWHTRCCAGLPGDIGDVGTRGIPIPPRDQASDRGRCTRSDLGGASDAMARHSCVAVLPSAPVGMSRAVVIVIARPRTRSRRRSL